MILFLLIVLWLVFGVLAASSLLFRDYQYHQVLGVTLSKAHSRHPEIRGTIASFTKACYAVLIISVGCGFLLLIPVVGRFAEFVMFALVALNLFANWIVIGHFQSSLIQIKEKNNWVYQKTGKENIITADLDVARGTGSSSISSVWVWLFLLLSFLPTLFLLFHPEERELYPIGLSLIGPLCQTLMVFLYYQMRSLHSRMINGKAGIHSSLARQEERINSITATFSSLAMLIFWLLFHFSMLYVKNGLFVLAPVILLIAALLGIARWQQRKMRSLDETYSDDSSNGEESIQEQQNSWKWGVYHNPNDPRIFVPKRIASMGWTINAGRPAGKFLYFGTGILILLIIGIVAFGGAKDYQITVQDRSLHIDAAMYDMTIKRDEIVSISMTDQLPDGTRTNGYGGANKSFGHFALKGYGKCMLYIYNHVNRYIIVQLKGRDPGYVILNDKTPEKTEALHRTIDRWLSEK